MITIRNTIHNTSVRLRADWGQQLTVSQMRRAERELCGLQGCQCGALHRDPAIEVDYTGEQNGIYLATLWQHGVDV